MGKPNVGKSTLINHMLGQKVAAVSFRPQTTRKKQMGILTTSSSQMIFMDTPGIHEPRNKLGDYMNKEATQVMDECDLILWIVDASQAPDQEDTNLADQISRSQRSKPVILALNKIDLVDEYMLEANSNAYMEMTPGSRAVQICAKSGENVAELLKVLEQNLPAGVPFFPEGQVTDLYEREIAADLIREAALNMLRDEVPHGIAIRIDQFTERNDHGAYIEATVFVERESHKGIVIGRGGLMLKSIGSAARKEIEEMSGRSVYLRLRVKVRKNWRNDEKVLRWFGY